MSTSAISSSGSATSSQADGSAPAGILAIFSTTSTASTALASTTLASTTTASTSLSSQSTMSQTQLSSSISASSPTSTPDNASVPTTSTNLNTKAIIGIAIGAAVLIISIVIGSLVIMRRRRKYQMANSNPESSDPSSDSSEDRAGVDTEKVAAWPNTTVMEMGPASGVRSPGRSRSNSALTPVSEEGLGHRSSSRSRGGHMSPTSTHMSAETLPLKRSGGTTSPRPGGTGSPRPGGTTSPRPYAVDLITGRALPRSGHNSPIPMVGRRARAASFEDDGPPQLPELSIPQRQSSNRFSSSPVVSRDQIRRSATGSMRSNKASSDRGTPRPPRARSPSTGSEPGSRRRLGAVSPGAEDDLENRYSRDVLDRLREEHARIRDERARLMRLQELDEEEDWIRQQIADGERNNWRDTV